MRTGSLRFIRYWLPILIWIGVIFVGSTDLMSAEHTSRIIGPILRWLHPGISSDAVTQVQLIVRKAAHLSEYALLSFLIFRALRNSFPGTSFPRFAWITILSGVVVAALDEFHQSFVPSRTSSARDVLIDFCGVLLGVTIYGSSGWQKK